MLVQNTNKEKYTEIKNLDVPFILAFSRSFLVVFYCFLKTFDNIEKSFKYNFCKWPDKVIYETTCHVLKYVSICTNDCVCKIYNRLDIYETMKLENNNLKENLFLSNKRAIEIII